MVVIHVAGAPASGKSTLGAALAEFLATRGTVLDLDDVNRAFAEGNGLVRLTREDPAKFQALYQAHIDELVRGHRGILVFVGIEGAVLGTMPGRHFRTVDLHAAVRLCLDTPTPVNVQRWIQRDMPELIDELAQSLKADVASFQKYRDEERNFVKGYEKYFHELMRDFRPSQRTDDIERFKKYYRKKGYHFASAADIVDLIEARTSK
jgi:uridine kinase